MKTTLALFTCLLVSAVANAKTPTAESFGKTKDGTSVELYTIQAESGIVAKVMTRGATLVGLDVPDKEGDMADVLLGFDDVSGYESDDNQYFGCTAGRVCNRIAKGKFTLDGKEYSLAINNEPNHLHGGVERSLDKVVWDAKPFSNDKGSGVTFSYTSPDGEEGYPGNLKATVRYFVAAKGHRLSISYSATTDKATPVNLTNHAYFNLSGEGSETVLDHVLMINADRFTPVDDTLIPTGEIKPVEGTELDFRKHKKIGARIDSLTDTAAIGYDHNFVLNEPKETGKPRFAAVLKDPKSGRAVRISTSEIGIQFYSGNFLKGQKGKGGKAYPHRSAVCLETQHFPDSVNHEQFPSTILKPGETYQSTTHLMFPTAVPVGEAKPASEAK
ncbi:aldose epimerase family protein [Planctomycetes bacterium K23_9]|uniref:Aldose 1-epimerase n=1 Tax=Stieleria marina TaxID=1930275 RepID=A0A517NTM4_9BACT|nr:Aldose 1-epimerase precursor [Planctomycetes bacterium K23_9]